MPKPPPDPDRVATALALAAAEGDEVAAKRFGVHVGTIGEWRRRSKDNPVICEKLAVKKQQVAEGWIEKARSARSKVLERMLALVEISDDLHDVVGAYKTINDGVLAEQIVSESDGNSNGGRTESSASVEGAGEGDPQASDAGEEFTH